MSLLWCVSKSMISVDGREANLLPQAAPWRCIHELAHVAFQAERRCDGTAEVLPLVSKVAGVLRCLFWRLENVMLWRGIMGFVQFGDKRVSDPVLLSCSWSCMLVSGNSIQAHLHTPHFPYVLIIILFPCPSCLQHFVPLPASVFSYEQPPNKLR